MRWAYKHRRALVIGYLLAVVTITAVLQILEARGVLP